MGQLAFEHEVAERLQGKPHLQPVFSDPYDIARRIREQDPSFFVVWNTRRRAYEIHCLNHIGDTYALDVPNNRLDARVEHVLRKNNIRTRGMAIFREIDDANERLERSIERQRRNELRAIAGEVKPYFERLAWEGI
ncbi:MAG: 2-hydroxyacyl-CoA dehydratase family protein [Firmicutes bacterium]|nr:2-hydroxyacyl-CoA dehydratase family protein [Bacillota bacterium]